MTDTLTTLEQAFSEVAELIEAEGITVEPGRYDDLRAPAITTFAEAVDAAWERRPARLVVGDISLARRLRAALDDRVGAGADLVVIVCGEEELYASVRQRPARPASEKQLVLLRRLRGPLLGDDTLSAEEASAEIDELIGGDR